MNKYSLILVSIFLSGCNYYVVKPVFNSSKIVENNITENSGHSKNLPRDFYVEGKHMINSSGAEFIKALQEAKDDRGKRNNLLSKIMLLSSTVCTQHKGNILANSAKINVGLGTLTTIFTSLGTALKGESTKAGLAAAATITNSTKTLVNDEVYYNTFAIAIIKAIDMDRKTMKSAILDNMKKKVNDYGVVQGIFDINEFHNACSFMNGLKLVSEAIDKRRPSKEQILEKINKLKAELGAQKTNGTGLSQKSNTQLFRKGQKKYSATSVEIDAEIRRLYKQYAREF